MKFFYLLLAALIAPSCYAAQKAITDTGDEIIIYSNGTWKYADDRQSAPVGIETNQTRFVKPKEATFLLKSKKNRSAFWLNTDKWSFKRSQKNADAEYAMQLKGKDLYGLAIAEEVQIPIESLADIALENARNVAPDIHMVKKEYRTVNDNKVIFMQMSGTMQGMKISYLGYYYSDKSGSTQYITYTASNLVDKYRADINDFLNGLVQQ
jgi:hypothetical protein